MDGCVTEGCDRKRRVIARGLCSLHYQRLMRNGPDGLHVTQKPRDRACSVDGCERKHESLGYCLMHLTRFRRNGDPGDAEPSRPVASGPTALFRHVTVTCASVCATTRAQTSPAWCSSTSS
jgi:hypothetical protein